ncbi:hypothetical protein DAEQUDRAFT_741902 [Daedalea quercina L-15889]|uniref:Uncharacterized protein n=1 Tax=Daedalea quercina L-15889 TaxID=1314783 RepID=A0A165KQV4_9APHY|nr:hypothetical protein DAEQUDRAFT_741902 [Daedalea quercina L-15889]
MSYYALSTNYHIAFSTISGARSAQYTPVIAFIKAYSAVLNSLRAQPILGVDVRGVDVRVIAAVSSRSVTDDDFLDMLLSLAALRENTPVPTIDPLNAPFNEPALLASGTTGRDDLDLLRVDGPPDVSMQDNEQDLLPNAGTAANLNAQVPIDPQLSGLIPDALAALHANSPAVSHQAHLSMQHLNAVAMANHLRPTARTMLRRYIEARNEEQQVMISGALLAIQQQLDATASVANDLWVLPDRVEMQITKYAIRILLSPDIVSYGKASPLHRLKAIILRKRFGLSPTLEDDDNGKLETVLDYARRCLTQRKSEAKKVITASYKLEDIRSLSEVRALTEGKNIVELCKALLKIGTKKVPSGTNINVTPQMCARVAFLRSVHFEHGRDDAYWHAVDKELISWREKANYNDAIFSVYMQQILERDRTLFPCKQWKEVENAQQTTGQTEVDAALRTGDMTALDVEADNEPIDE